MIEEWKTKQAKKAERADGKGRTKKGQLDETDGFETGEEGARPPGRLKNSAAGRPGAKAGAKGRVREKQAFPMSSPPPVEEEETTEDETVLERHLTKAKEKASFPLSPPTQPNTVSLLPRAGMDKGKHGAGLIDGAFKARKTIHSNVVAGKPVPKNTKDVLSASRSRRQGEDQSSSDDDNDRAPPPKTHGKPPMAEKNPAGRSKVAEVAASFADSDVIRDLTQRPVPSRTSSKILAALKEKEQPPSKPPSRATKAKADIEGMYRTDSAESHTSTSTNASTSTVATTASGASTSTANTLVSESGLRAGSSSPRKAQPQPFPMSFDFLSSRGDDDDDDHDDSGAEVDWEKRFSALRRTEQVSAKGKERGNGRERTMRPPSHTAHQSAGNAAPESSHRDVGPTTPRRGNGNARKQGPDKDAGRVRTLDDLCSSDRNANANSDSDADADGRASPTPRKRVPLPRKPVRDGTQASRAEPRREVIVISSDEEGRSPVRDRRGRKRVSDALEVIEISD